MQKKKLILKIKKQRKEEKIKKQKNQLKNHAQLKQ